MSTVRNLLPLFITFLLISTAAGADSEIWFDEPGAALQLQHRTAGQANHRYLRADISILKQVMSAAPLENDSAATSYIDLPLPDGVMHTFIIEESPVLSSELSAKFPEFKTYRVQAKENPAISGRLDLLPTGFHAYLTTDNGVVFIDPDPDAKDHYRSFYKHEYISNVPRLFSCGVEAKSQPLSEFYNLIEAKQKTVARNSNQLLTYRLAVAATREYSLAVAGGNVVNTMAAITTTINRVNEIFGRDLGISLQLVIDNGLVSTDVNDFSNDDPFLLIAESKPFIDNVIGVSSYDVGHVFSTGAGGLALLGSVCDSLYKAEGVTGVSNPVGDAFYIDFVAHEIGHQFGAEHSFNGTTSNCGGGNRNAGSAFEPGSGSTIMAYAGICGAENVQLSAASPTAGGASEDTFHAGSIDQIVNFTRIGAGSNCDVLTTNSNTAPVANAGMDYIIPGRTPFELTGSATDINPDTLTYQWDEMDTGTATTSLTYGRDLGSNPLFRSFSPLSVPVRTLPRIETIVSGIDDKAEKLPETDRTLNFRLTVRDQNRGVHDDDMQVTVDKDSGPFRVLTPATAVTLDVTQPQVIEWAVACTDSAPVDCANVDILLSTDSGASFPTVLLAATANDGEETVNFPALNSTTAVIKIACTDNIFFDVNDDLITLEQGSGIALISTGADGGVCAAGGGGSVSFDVSNAISVDLNSDITDSVNDNSDVTDVFQFTGSNDVYTFLLSDYGSSDLDLYLTDSNGEVLVQSTGTTATQIISTVLVEGVTYHLVVTAEDTGAATQDYTVTTTRVLKPLSTDSDSGSSSMNLWFLTVLILSRRLHSYVNRD